MTTAIRDARGVRSIDFGTIWVCQCCMLSHANGECCADDTHGGDSIAPWADLDWQRFGVTMGLGAEDHAEDCEVRLTGEWPVNYECDCDRIDFSRARCDGCGSYLHGERHAFSLWRERQRFAHSAGVTQ